MQLKYSSLASFCQNTPPAVMVTSMIPESDSTTTSATASSALHSARTFAQWSQLQSLIRRKNIVIDGESLSISGLVAVARLVICPSVSRWTNGQVLYRYGCEPNLDQSPSVVRRIEESVATLQGYLDEGYSVYGEKCSRP